MREIVPPEPACHEPIEWCHPSARLRATRSQTDRNPHSSQHPAHSGRMNNIEQLNPTRVLHIIDPDHDTVGPCATALMAESLGVSSPFTTTTLLIGPTPAERHARRVGILTEDRISPPHGKPWLALTAFQRYLRRIGPVDLIHTWSLGTLALAAIAAPRTPRLLTLTASPETASSGHWLNLLAKPISRQYTDKNEKRTTMLATGQSVRQAWGRFGLDPRSTHVVQPGLDLSRIEHTHRKNIRSEWGVEDDSQMVIGVPAHPARRVDAWRAAKILCLSRLAGLETTVVISPQTSRLDSARHLANGVNVGMHFIVDERMDRPWEIMSGIDVGIALGDRIDEDDQGSDHHANTDGTSRQNGTLSTINHLWSGNRTNNGNATQRRPIPGVLPMLWMAAAGKMIIAEAGSVVSEWIEHNHSGLLVKPGRDPLIVDRLLQVAGLHDHETDIEKHNFAMWELRNTARSEMFTLCSVSRYITSLQVIYSQILSNDDIRVPGLSGVGVNRIIDRTPVG